MGYVWTDVNSDYSLDANPELVHDALVIRKSIKNIAMCMIGTRPHVRWYGSWLKFFIQEPNDEYSASQIKASFLQSLSTCEPRIHVMIEESVVQAQSTQLSIQVKYVDKQTGLIDTYGFSLQRIA